MVKLVVKVDWSQTNCAGGFHATYHRLIPIYRAQSHHHNVQVWPQHLPYHPQQMVPVPLSMILILFTSCWSVLYETKAKTPHIHYEVFNFQSSLVVNTSTSTPDLLYLTMLISGMLSFSTDTVTILVHNGWCLRLCCDSGCLNALWILSSSIFSQKR